MEQNDFQKLATRLKTALRTRKVTYAALAHHLEISESALKKYLNGQDGSFERLCQIANFIGIHISELFELESRRSAKRLRFSDEQGRYLIEDSEALATFFLLLYDGLTVAEVRKRLNLSQSRMNRILRELDKLKLIVWMPNDHIPYHKEGIVIWEDEGEFVGHIRQNWSRALLKATLQRPTKDSEKSFHLTYFKLTETSAKQLQRDLQDLMYEYHRRSRQEINYFGLRELNSVRMLACLLPGSYIE